MLLSLAEFLSSWISFMFEIIRIYFIDGACIGKLALLSNTTFKQYQCGGWTHADLCLCKNQSPVVWTGCSLFLSLSVVSCWESCRVIPNFFVADFPPPLNICYPYRAHIPISGGVRW